MERRAFIPLATLAFYLLPPLAWEWNLVTPTLSALIVFVAFPRLRRLAQRDPQLLASLPGHLRLARFYPARAHHATARRRVVPTL